MHSFRFESIPNEVISIFEKKSNLAMKVKYFGKSYEFVEKMRKINNFDEISAKSPKNRYHQNFLKMFLF